MRYFQDTSKQFFGIDVGQESLIKPDWVEVTKADIDKANEPTQEQKKQGRISELKINLAQTDYKVMPDYDKPNDEIKKQRQAWRDEIRALVG
jgi:FtsZ-binding cell division protein ZapB